MEKYQVIKKVGAGSYGSVFVVKAKRDGKKYVMKRIPLKDMSAKEKKAAKQEVALLQTLQHPHIVAYKDSFLDNNDKDLCIVMTNCEGGDLSSKIKKHRYKKIPESQIMIWFVQILLAVEFLHTRKVLHRDLKSQNIFLMKDGTVKLGDFGIARVFDKTLDMAKTTIGTPLYMAPEVCNNRPYSYKSDVWSVGCILYEMCTRRHPFDAHDLKGLFMKIIRGVYSPIPFSYSQKMRGIIKRMLSTNSHKRPTLTQILKSSYIKKYLMKLGHHIMTTPSSASELSATFNADQIERSNFLMQLNELGVNPESIESAAQEKKEVKKRDPSPAASSNSSSSSASSKKASKKSNHPPISARGQHKRVPLRDMKKAVAKYDFMHKERERYKKKLEDARKKKKERQERRKAEMEALEKAKQKKILEKQKKRLERAKEKRRNMRVHGYRIKNKPLKSDKKLKSEVEEIQRLEKKREAERQLVSQLEKDLQSGNKHQDYLDHIQHQVKPVQYHQAAQPSTHAAQPLSHRDRILKQKLEKKQREENERRAMLEAARRENHKNAMLAKEKERAQYHGNYDLPSSRYKQNNQFEQQQQKKYRHLDSDSEDDDDDDEEEEYKKIIHEHTTQLNEFRRTMTQAFGRSYEDIKKMVDAPKERKASSPAKKPVVQAKSHHRSFESDDDDEFIDEDDQFDDEIVDDPEYNEEDELAAERGRLKDRIKYVRHNCEKAFGQRLFDDLYNEYKRVNLRNVPEDKRVQHLVKFMGPAAPKIGHIHLIEELLFAEEAFQ
mmetsp:Transcript_289/g.525  ORF Transcript_289/g.525 Transcript_289/m.525 type:complete len:776 (-) Transcript_289:11-2338(-)